MKPNLCSTIFNSGQQKKIPCPYFFLRRFVCVCLCVCVAARMTMRMTVVWCCWAGSGPLAAADSECAKMNVTKHGTILFLCAHFFFFIFCVLLAGPQNQNHNKCNEEKERFSARKILLPVCDFFPRALFLSLTLFLIEWVPAEWPTGTNKYKFYITYKEIMNKK